MAAPEEMPTKSALFPGGAPGVLEGVVVGDLDDLVDDGGVEDGRTKPAPDAWIGCGPFWPPEETTGDAAARRRSVLTEVALLQRLADTGDRAAVPDGDDEVNLAVGVVPRSRGGGGRWIGGCRVLETAGDEVALVGLRSSALAEHPT